MKYKILVIDDEPLARKLILSHVSKVEVLEVAGECSNAIEAANVLRRTPVDLLFLDVQMPELNGLDFIRTLRQPPAIVLTTGYREFAAEAFELNVMDYLVKPISFERFLKCMDKFTSVRPPLHSDVSTDIKPQVISIRADRKLFPVQVSSIVYVESLDNYVKVYLTDKVLITHETISSLEARLSPVSFVRIHRSYLVNPKFIISITAESVFINKTELPFGRAYRQAALQALGYFEK